MGSFLVQSPTWVGEIGAPTFTNAEAGRFLRPSVAGGGATGIPRVADTGGAAATSELAGEVTSLLLTGPEETGGDIKVAGATEMVEGLSTAGWMAPTDETGVSFKPLFGEAGI